VGVAAYDLVEPVASCRANAAARPVISSPSSSITRHPPVHMIV
jgi:hypothetical protein